MEVFKKVVIVKDQYLVCILKQVKLARYQFQIQEDHSVVQV
jgi:hypothetical protein